MEGEEGGGEKGRGTKNTNINTNTNTNEDIDTKVNTKQELSGRCCEVEKDCGVEEALREELRFISTHFISTAKRCS